MKKFIYFITLLGLILFYHPCRAQYSEDKPFGLQIETGYGIRLKDTHSSSVQLLVSPYYRVNPNFSIGIGSGYVKYLNAMGSGSIPLYAHANYRFETQSRFKPFIGLKMGYSFLSEEQQVVVGDIMGKFKREGGGFLSPTVGFAYKTNKNHTLLFSVSYGWLNYGNEWRFAGHPHQDVSLKKSNSTISINIGYEF